MFMNLDKAGRLLGIWAAAISVVFAMPLSARAQDIVIGQVGPFTVIPVPDAIEVNQGIKAYVAQINKAGGINGRKLVLFELDDRYSGDEYVTQFGRAMERKPVALISPIGSAAIKRMLDDKLLDKHDVVVMNAIPGAESFRNPGHPRLFHVRVGDKQQIEKLVNHARTLGISRLGVLYHDIPIGTSGMKVVTDEVARVGGLNVKGVQSTAELPAMAAASQELLKFDPQGVLVIGAPRFMADGVAQLRKAGISQSIFVLSYVPPALIVKLAGPAGARGVGIAQTFPNPNGKTKALLREFQSAMKVGFPDLEVYTPFQLEGYLSTRIVGEALKRVRGEPKPESLVKALQSMGELDFDGYRVDFSKGNAGSRFVDIAVVDTDGRLRY
jgi:ABC-type branched-subunit amino acid transport system substrate-binding protein